MAASNQEELDDDTQSRADDGGDGAGELTDALSGGEEASFVTEDKKPVNRTSVLLFGVILLGAAGYYFMYARGTPASADAAEVAATGAAQADDTINQFLSSGEENAKQMRLMRQTTDKVVAQFKSSEVAQVPVDNLQANPFKYAPAADDAAAAAAAAAKKRDEERSAAMAAVQTLQLQSVLAGTRPACMINNQMYTEGQTVAGFTIEKITAGTVVVKSGQFRFQLKMQR